MNILSTPCTLDFPPPEVDHRRLELRLGGKIWETTAVFSSYWRFAAERQAIFFRRLKHIPQSTTDPILQTFKFTNVYRASDRVSQYLIRNVIYGDDQEPIQMFFRIVLYKLFNKIETWSALSAEIPDLAWRKGVIEEIDAVLSRRIDQGISIYSGAYIMPSGGREYSRKHRAHLQLLKSMMDMGIYNQIRGAASMQESFQILLKQPMLGTFLAYQLATDINYSTLCDFSESEFVIPGPGARDGLRKCFPELPMKLGADAIKAVCDFQEAYFKSCEITFPTLWGRPLQLIDCQNLFCEIDKYSRIAHPEVSGISGRTRIKQHYKSRGDLPEPFYPPKWRLAIK